MTPTRQEPYVQCDDAINVEVSGERKHFICIRLHKKEEGYIYDLFDDEGYITSIDDRTFESYLNLGAIIIKPAR